MNRLIMAGGLVATLAAAPALADHNNPWAGPDDEVKSQFHDRNQAFSADRPGEDEMRGVANGKGRAGVPGRTGAKGAKRGGAKRGGEGKRGGKARKR